MTQQKFAFTYPPKKVIEGRIVCEKENCGYEGHTGPRTVHPKKARIFKVKNCYGQWEVKYACSICAVLYDRCIALWPKRYREIHRNRIAE